MSMTQVRWSLTAAKPRTLACDYDPMHKRVRDFNHEAHELKSNKPAKKKRKSAKDNTQQMMAELVTDDVNHHEAWPRGHAVPLPPMVQMPAYLPAGTVNAMLPPALPVPTGAVLDGSPVLLNALLARTLAAYPVKYAPAPEASGGAGCNIAMAVAYPLRYAPAPDVSAGTSSNLATAVARAPSSAAAAVVAPPACAENAGLSGPHAAGAGAAAHHAAPAADHAAAAQRDATMDVERTLVAARVLCGGLSADGAQG